MGIKEIDTKRVKEDCDRLRKALEKMPPPRAMFTPAEFEEMAMGGIQITPKK